MTDPKRPNRVILAGVCLFAAMLLVVAGRWWWRSSSREEAALFISPQGLQVGQVMAQDGYTHAFVLTNRGDRPLGIDRFVTSCSCAELRPTRVRLEPGETAALQLKLNLLQYLRLSDERIIPASIKVTPVVSGVPDLGWMLYVEVLRPDAYTFSSEVDFGLVPSTTTDIESAETVYFTDAAADVWISTRFPLVSETRLVPVEGAKPGYCVRRIAMTLSGQPRPFGEFTFLASIGTESAGVLMDVPCRIRFDSGLRADVDLLPPRIVHVGQPVRWSVSVHRVGGPLTKAGLRVVSRLGDYALDITPEPPDPSHSSRWTFRCECVPEDPGNLHVMLEATGELAEGIVVTQPVELRFYALSGSLTAIGP